MGQNLEWKLWAVVLVKDENFNTHWRVDPRKCYTIHSKGLRLRNKKFNHSRNSDNDSFDQHPVVDVLDSHICESTFSFSNSNICKLKTMRHYFRHLVYQFQASLALHVHPVPIDWNAHVTSVPIPMVDPLGVFQNLGEKVPP